jgi:uncharacterized protein YutE (UPF0331/DUF86 family)
MVDRDLVLRRLADLETYLSQLAPFRQIDLDSYRDDWKTQRIVERTLHLAIETCMDVADHLVADARLRVPETGAATFDILAEGGILSRALAPALGRMVGFRNILVHDYTRIDQALVLKILRQDISDLERFRDEVVAYIRAGAAGV